MWGGTTVRLPIDFANGTGIRATVHHHTTTRDRPCLTHLSPTESADSYIEDSHGLFTRLGGS